MSHRVRLALAAGTAASALAAAGCGGSAQDANEPSGRFPVEIVAASFPARQQLAQQSRMTISIRNTGSQAIPNLAVTVTTPGAGTAAQAFADTDTQPGLAARSRPTWIVDAGPAGGNTASADTWTLGRLAAGRTATFTWRVTPVKPGAHAVHYRVAASLNGVSQAVLAGGGVPEGDFRVRIDARPAHAIVDDAGRVVTPGN